MSRSAPKTTTARGDAASLPAAFVSEHALREAFAVGLERLVEADGLGPFILGCANAAFDPDLLPRLEPRLRRRFEALRATPGEDANPADREVFARLSADGLERSLEPTRLRRAGPWEVQFNRLRGYRPLRAGGAPVSGLRVPFDPAGFHFDKPFLAKEVFWSGELCGREVALLYNKFPFVTLHGLLVPEPKQHRPQFLEADLHAYVWALTERLGRVLPGVMFGYNAYGAFASVNHLHLQMAVRAEPLPVAAPHWRHNGGKDTYPAACERYGHAGAAWERITDLHRSGRHYNLVYLPGRMYLLPRRAQGSYRHSPWTSGYAWYEMAGGTLAGDEAAFAALDQATLTAELALAGGEENP